MRTSEDFTDEQITRSARDHASYGWSTSKWGCWNPEQNALYDREYYADRDIIRKGGDVPSLGRTLWNVVAQVCGHVR
jgi:hypothetical protein